MNQQTVKDSTPDQLRRILVEDFVRFRYAETPEEAAATIAAITKIARARGITTEQASKDIFDEVYSLGGRIPVA